MSQKLSVDGFKWRKDKFRFGEEFMQIYEEESDKRCMLISSVNTKYLRATQLHSDLPFLPKRLKNVKSSCLICMARKKYVIQIKALK